MRVVRIDPHEAANIELSSGTVIILDDEAELLDLFTVLVFARVGGVAEKQLLPKLRAAILRQKQPE